MNKKNLLTLADFLDALPRKKFNFGYWFTPVAKPKRDLSCGTKACALGWAATIPAFKRLGVGISLKKYEDGETGVDFTLDGKQSLSEKVAVRLFDIGYNDFDDLFVKGPMLPAHRYEPTPKDIAKHIRKFVTK